MIYQDVEGFHQDFPELQSTKKFTKLISHYPVTFNTVIEGHAKYFYKLHKQFITDSQRLIPLEKRLRLQEKELIHTLRTLKEKRNVVTQIISLTENIKQQKLLLIEEFQDKQEQSKRQKLQIEASNTQLDLEQEQLKKQTSELETQKSELEKQYSELLTEINDSEKLSIKLHAQNQELKKQLTNKERGNINIKRKCDFLKQQLEKLQARKRGNNKTI